VTLDTFGQLLGRLHPLVVHFPVALLMVAGAIETWRALRRKAGPSPAALVCVGIGAAGAVAAAGFGWLNAAYEQDGPDGWVLAWHRWLGVTVACIAAMAGAAAWSASRGRGVGPYRAMVIASALLVAVGGHFGGMLTYGEGYITDAALAVWRGPAPVPAAAPEPEVAPGAVLTVDFQTQVRPILESSCLSCHGAKKMRGGLRLDAREAAMKGGKSGAVIVPGDAEASELLTRLITEDEIDRMPLDKPPLPDDQIAIIRTWIEEGAHWTDGPRPISGAGAADQEHWSYLPPVRAEPPKVQSAGWSRGEIDRFVLAAMERQGLTPSPEADREMLIRRVSLDLIGLPPTPAEVDAFLADASPDAYEKVVDALLASPRYGERWAQPWLDLARYADSNGYEKDGDRTIWPWRDWVIEALNADMPFDRFTIEQIAGDLLPEPTRAQMIATGFHRNSMINEEGGVDPEEYRVNAVIDRANTTATVWLGATLGCAQCHDHKFDSFSQKEYFGFYAFFNNDAEESRQGDGEFYVEISPKLRLEDPRNDEVEGLIAAIEAEPAAGEDDQKAREEVIAGLRARLLPEPETLVMQRLEGGRITRVMQRGDFRNPAEEVPPNVPAVLPPMTEGGPRDRLGLAHWLVSAENPLTARVTVNRLWQEHFGRGIVETSDDFGLRGTAPTHPELLDWLAMEFVRLGWSQKAMHRLIVTSATYRQASEVSAEALEKDPGNKWLARGARVRMSGEMVRDQALAASGLLSEKMGGPGVFPVQPEGVWANPYADNTWRTSAGEDRHRRSVYTYWKRSSPYPLFATFDAPARQIVCTRRVASDTPLQALVMMNDPVFVEAAAGVAGRALREASGERGRAELVFRLCLGRRPTEEEGTRLEALYREQLAGFEADPGAAHELVSASGDGAGAADEIERAAWMVVANVVMNLDEFVTRG
jgi:uncharacterized membrane protein